MRIIHPEVTLIWLMFFLKGLGWENTATYDPDMISTESLSPTNYVLKFFLYVFLIMTIGTV